MKPHAAHVVGLCAAVGAIALAFSPAPCRANNLAISGVSLIDAGANVADIQFTMSWDNSWHETWTESGGSITVTNWDAVWVFAKYRQNGGLWKHVRLTGTGHTATGGTVIDVPDDGGGTHLGALVHRNATGSGTVTCTDMKLRWDLAAAGIPSADDIDVTVMGVEMVYIPEGAFYLGSGGTESRAFHTGGDTTVPFLVESEAEIATGTDPGQLGSIGTDPLPAAFPKGYAAFYCMKYEITEGQYVDFLNLLDPGIVATYFTSATGSRRHTIAEAAGGGYETSAPDRACSYINYVRVAHYLDWSGLRPMTELEFEKTCRGVKQPWINEYAWGNTTFAALTGFVGTDGSGTETADPPAANSHLAATVNGPVRVGLFATGATTREAAGAGYYGVMNLSDNLLEVTMSAGASQARGFDGSHGDGDVYTSFTLIWSSSYYAYMARGGSYANGASLALTSFRGYSSDTCRYQHEYTGGRGVRTAP